MISLSVITAAIPKGRIELDFFVPESAWSGAFDRFEIWRSKGTAEGPYDQLHDTGAQPARLPVGAGPPPASPQTGPSIPLNGKQLTLLLNELTPLTITFAGSDPFTFAQAATAIVAQSAGLLNAYVLGPLLVVATVQAGLAAALRATGGNAAPLLGLPTVGLGAVAFGRDARIVLVSGQEDYGFVDPWGSPSYFYKTRFFSSQTSTVSQFSTPIQPLAAVGLSQASLVRCYVDLVDMQGNPAPNQEVLFYNQFNATQVENKVVTGGSLRFLTDVAGHAEALLPRGTQITVSIGGTPLARDVLVPTDPTIQSLNLLAASSGTNDLFDVQVPDLPYATRRTL
jgi:hypothetical protein